MQRTSRAMAAGVCALLCVGNLSGCSQSYAGERLFWKAEQLSVSLLKDPANASPEEFQRVIAAFKHIVEIMPGTEWAGRSQLAIGSLYAVQRHYGPAREAFAEVLRNASAFGDLYLQARLATAKTYEKEQAWDQAAAAYWEVANFHPWSPPGLEAPLYIARTYQQHQMTAQANDAYGRAVSLYTGSIPQAPSQELVLQMKSYLALCYQGLEKWREAAALLEELAHEAKANARPVVLMTLAQLYETRLEELAKAKALYAQLAREFPEHALGKFAKARLERLNTPVATP